MKAANPHSFVPELGNLQTDRVLEPRGHEPTVAPPRIGWRLFEAQQRWGRSPGERLDFRKDLVWVERSEDL